MAVVSQTTFSKASSWLKMWEFFAELLTEFCTINNIPALVQLMAWRRSGDKPLSEQMIDYRRIYSSHFISTHRNIKMTFMDTGLQWQCTACFSIMFSCDKNRTERWILHISSSLLKKYNTRFQLVFTNDEQWYGTFLCITVTLPGESTHWLLH